MNAEAEELESVAAVADRLAVLLGAGVAPGVAWSCLAEPTDQTGPTSARPAAPGPVVGRMLARLRRRPPDAGADAPRILRSAADAAAVGGDVATAILAALAAASVPSGAVAASPAHAGSRDRAGSRRRPAPARLAARARPALLHRPSTPSGARDSAPRSAAARAWAALAAAWSVAVEAGAPLGPALGALASALRADAELERAVEAALAGPRASARLVQALPLIAVAFGLVLGFDTAGVLLGSPLGIACLLGGLALLAAGRRWNRGLAASAARRPLAPGLGCELVAIAMSGGASVALARERAARALERCLPGADGDDATIDDVVALGGRAGAPVAALLRGEGSRLRRTAQSGGILRAEALAVRLMVPLGVCILPAFALLGVAPLLISVVTGTLGVVP